MNAASAIDALKTNPKAKVEVSDTAANIQANFDALTQMGGSVTKITVSDPATKINLTAAQYSAGVKTLASIKSSYSLKVTNVTMDQLNERARELNNVIAEYHITWTVRKPAPTTSA
jgi:hypothetical protein